MTPWLFAHAANHTASEIARTLVRNRDVEPNFSVAPCVT